MRIARLFALLIWVIGPGAAIACSGYPQGKLPTVALPIVSGDIRILLKVELAQTEDQRNCGLMGRPKLADGTGMLFDMRPPGPAFFWMKNTPESLDLVFLDATGRAVYLVRHAEPFSTDTVGTGQAIAAVLELAAGEAERLGIGFGSRAGLPWLNR